MFECSGNLRLRIPCENRVKIMCRILNMVLLSALSASSMSCFHYFPPTEIAAMDICHNPIPNASLKISYGCEHTTFVDNNKSHYFEREIIVNTDDHGKASIDTSRWFYGGINSFNCFKSIIGVSDPVDCMSHRNDEKCKILARRRGPSTLTADLRTDSDSREITLAFRRERILIGPSGKKMKIGDSILNPDCSLADGPIWRDITTNQKSTPTKRRLKDAISSLQWSPIFSSTTKSGADGLCKNLQFDGLDDWRLPSYTELLTAFEHGLEGTPNVRPLDLAATHLWTATPITDENTHYWTVDVGGGSLSQISSAKGDVICVRSDRVG
jgi:hypothetical protein